MELQSNAEDNPAGEYYQYAKNLAGRLYRQWGFYNMDLDELEGAALLGLCEAAERYEEEKNDSFKNFSYLRVRGAILDQVQKEAAHSQRLTKPFVSKEVRGKTEEKSKTSDYPVSSHQELGQLLATFDSLNMDLEVPRSGQNSALVYRDQRAADETIADAERDEYLRGLIAGLTEEERQILYQHYYCGRRFCEMSFEGKKRSRSWVCRKHTQALAHLRASIERDSSNEEGLV